MNNWRIKLALLLIGLNTLGVLAVIPYSLTLLGTQALPENALPISLVVLINSFIQIAYMSVLILIGLRLQARTGLQAPLLQGLVYPQTRVSISKKWVIRSVVGALIGSIFIVLLDNFIFTPLIDMPSDQIPSPNWWQGLLASIYGGVTEEIWLRLFGMTLIVWLLARITNKTAPTIPASFYSIAIFLVAILFGLGHLPATMQVFGELSLVLVLRALVLNGLLGIWFGYLYWKKGLEYAMIAHLTADISLHVLLAALLSF